MRRSAIVVAVILLAVSAIVGGILTDSRCGRLVDAVRAADRAEVQRLLGVGAFPDCTVRRFNILKGPADDLAYETTPLLEAVRLNHQEIARELLTHLSQAPSSMELLVNWAIRFNNVEVLRALAVHAPAIGLLQYQGRPVMERAAHPGAFPSLLFLLIDAKRCGQEIPSGVLALMSESKYPAIRSLTCFASSGVEDTVLSMQGCEWTADGLQLAVSGVLGQQSVEALPSPERIALPWGWGTLEIISATSSEYIVENYMQSHAGMIDTRSLDSALQVAIESSNWGVANVLLGHGASLDAIRPYGKDAAYFIRLIKGSGDAIEQLRAAGKR